VVPPLAPRPRVPRFGTAMKQRPTAATKSFTAAGIFGAVSVITRTSHSMIINLVDEQ
jgi:hypothetical protein